MWVRRAAIRPVPAFAELPRHALEQVEDRLSDDEDAAQQELDEAFIRFEKTQPALADLISDALSQPRDETALALGYFLSLSIWLAFETTFKDELEEINQLALSSVEESLTLDEQIRLSDPAEAVETDDVIAMEQPHVLAFVHEHLDAALEAKAGEVDIEDVHAIYRLILVETLALSYAVRPPTNYVMMSNEFTA